MNIIKISGDFSEKNSIIEQHKKAIYDDASVIKDISWKLKILTDAAKYDVTMNALVNGIV